MDKPLHYEIHVTVKTEEVNRFIEECGAVGVKPIVLDLQKQDGGSIQDVMTSQKVTGNDTDAWTRMKETSWYLQSKGFNVVREKIETVPWHPKALVHGEDSKEGYFEAHVSVLMNDGTRDKISKLCKNLNLHLSKNAFKQIDETSHIQMATYRKNCSAEQFQTDIRYIYYCFSQNKLLTEKGIDTEFALYDSNVSHDAAWTGQ